MIIYACLMRLQDGMPLSATNAFSKAVEPQVQEGKRVVKLLTKQIQKLPQKVCIQGENLTVHCMRDESTSYIIVCEPSYPHILAYSFLDELMKEFSLLYTTSVVNAVKRPFGFIEFDSYMCKVQQKYNSPRSLASRLNLSDMTNDLNLNPPHYKKLSEFELLQSKTTDRTPPPYSAITISNGTLPNGVLKDLPENGLIMQMQPIAWYGRIALVFALPCILLDGYRGVVSLSSSNLEGEDGPSILHGMSFLAEMIFLLIQIYYLRKYSKHRKLVSLNCCIFILLLNFAVYDIREAAVVVVYVLVSLLLTLATVKRTFEKCLPKLNI